MKRVVATAAIAGLMLSTMVVAAAVLTAASPQRAVEMPVADALAAPSDLIEDWPAPVHPLTTLITPVESAGAPMFP